MGPPPPVARSGTPHELLAEIRWRSDRFFAVVSDNRYVAKTEEPAKSAVSRFRAAACHRKQGPEDIPGVTVTGKRSVPLNIPSS